MKITFFISFLLSFVLNYAQLNNDRENDSLYRVWNDSSVHDTNRANALQAYVYNKFYRTNLDSAKLLSDLHIEIAKRSKNNKTILNSYSLGAMVNTNIGNYKIAIDYAYKALQDSSCESRWKCQAHFHNTLGNIYTYMNEGDKALEQYEIAIDIQISNNGDSTVIGFLYSNIGNIFQGYNKDSALYFFKKSLEIQKALKNEFRIAQVNWNIGNAYTESPKKAISYYKKSFSYFKKLNYKTYLSSLANNISLSYVDLEDIYNANKYAKICYDNAYSSNSSIEIKKANKINYLIQQKKGNYKKALQFYEAATLISDSLNRASNIKALHEGELKYKYYKKNKADSILYAEEKRINEAELLLQDAKISSRRSLTKLFIIVLFVIVILSVVIWFRFQKSQDQKNIIQSQKNDVDQALADLKIKKEEIEHKNQEIINSINYAKYIQKSMLPDKEELKGFFANHFIFNQPKDIVGGDFYWFKSFDDIAIIVAADCTGHGVPGGFITMLGNLLIENSIGFKAKNPDKILKELNRDIITLLKQEEVDSIQDGMDISICLIDKKKRKIKFSGARNGLFIVNGDDVKSIKGSVSPVGGVYTKKETFMERDYNLEEIKVHENDWVFMYTDGYYDQFGGQKGKSMGSKKFTQILLESINNEKTNTKFFKDKFDQWKSNQSQIDDVLIIGFKI